MGHESTLRIGIVSGQTTRGTIEAMCNLPWDQYIDSAWLPRNVYCYTLKISQMQKLRELRGNANTLACSLARKFQS